MVFNELFSLTYFEPLSGFWSDYKVTFVKGPILSELTESLPMGISDEIG
jgi:hypothetical protein